MDVLSLWKHFWLFNVFCSGLLTLLPVEKLVSGDMVEVTCCLLLFRFFDLTQQLPLVIILVPEGLDEMCLFYRRISSGIPRKKVKISSSKITPCQKGKDSIIPYLLIMTALYNHYEISSHRTISISIVIQDILHTLGILVKTVNLRIK